jgi:hypothetical protein
LCIYGTHGCRKSVLASSLANGLESYGKQTLFFPFLGTEAGRQGIGSLVRSFLRQLLEESTNEQSLKIVHNLILKGQPSNTVLWEAFKKVVALVSVPVYCVIDGVDKSNDLTQLLLDHIKELLNSNANFHVILLGRPHRLQTIIGAATRAIEINSTLIKQDIDAFINAKLSESKILSLINSRDLVFKTL